MVVYENGIRKVNKEKTVCRECRAVINYTGSTTNMSTHVKRHPSLKMDTERKRKYGCTTSTVSSTSRATRSGQLTVTEAFKAKLPANSIRATQITKHIGAFMALDLRLF